MSSLRNVLFLGFIILIGFVVLYPQHNIKHFLTQGDNGRDLYCFRRTIEGDLPLKDFWWPYGPLMPFYYGLCYWFMGMNIQSILWGKIFILIASGLLIVLSLSLFFPRWIATGATLWFWAFNPDFMYTFNHIGGVAVLMASLYSLFLYIKNPRPSFLYAGIVCAFILMLIKINIGVVTLIAFFVSFSLIDFIRRDSRVKKRKIFILLAFLFLLVLSIYAWLLHGLSYDAIFQCFPLEVKAPAYSAGNLAKTLWRAFLSNATSNFLNLFFGLFVFLCGIRTLVVLQRSITDRRFKTEIFLLISTTSIILLANLHEFILSGFYYRIFWVNVFFFILYFIFIAVGTARLSAMAKFLIGGTLLIAMSSKFYGEYKLLMMLKVPPQYLSFRAAKIYVTNSPQWIDTVTKTTQYLQRHLKDSETFFALPYDPLYYFLMEKVSPTWYLELFEYSRISLQQEKGIVSALEEKNVNWILISSRFSSPVLGLGVFGVTHCPFLAKYIEDNFELVATFGDWQTPPQEAWSHHGTKILRRTTKTTGTRYPGR